MRSVCRTRASSSPPAVAVAVGTRSGALLPVFLLGAAASSSTFVLAADSVEHRHRRNDDNRNGNLQHGPAMHALRGGEAMTRRKLKRKRLLAYSSAHHPSHVRHNENGANKVAAATAVADTEPTSRNDSSTRTRRHARTSAIAIRQTREVDRDVDRSKHFRHSEKGDETKDSKSDSDDVQAVATLHFYHPTASAAASSTASANDRYYYDVGYDYHDGQQAQFPMDQALTADEHYYYLQPPDDLLNNRDADNDKQPMQQQAHLQFYIPCQLGGTRGKAAWCCRC